MNYLIEFLKIDVSLVYCLALSILFRYLFYLYNKKIIKGLGPIKDKFLNSIFISSLIVTLIISYFFNYIPVYYILTIPLLYMLFGLSMCKRCKEIEENIDGINHILSIINSNCDFLNNLKYDRNFNINIELNRPLKDIEKDVNTIEISKFKRILSSLFKEDISQIIFNNLEYEKIEEDEEKDIDEND